MVLISMTSSRGMSPLVRRWQNGRVLGTHGENPHFLQTQTFVFGKAAQFPGIGLSCPGQSLLLQIQITKAQIRSPSPWLWPVSHLSYPMDINAITWPTANSPHTQTVGFSASKQRPHRSAKSESLGELLHAALAGYLRRSAKDTAVPLVSHH